MEQSESVCIRNVSGLRRDSRTRETYFTIFVVAGNVASEGESWPWLMYWLPGTL